MSTAASIVFDPGSFVAWIIVGLITGWLAGKVMTSASYGVAGDVVLGPIGGVAGGLASGLFLQGDSVFWLSVLFALAGASLFIIAAHAVALIRRA
jgi:uncharacterized membrane protein YeaQ/YmgE (transglycosylase-associated protein family)